jgi:hypothetical protein
VPRLLVKLGDREARARRTLGIFIVRRGPAEVSHHAVSEIFRDVAVKARDRFGGRAMIPGDRLAPLLGVEPSGDPGRADQVAEQHRQMTPLADCLARAEQRCSGNRIADGRIESRGALATEIKSRGIFKRAIGAGQGQRSPALPAELHAGWILKFALRAAHRQPPISMDRRGVSPEHGPKKTGARKALDDAKGPELCEAARRTSGPGASRSPGSE